MRLERQVQRWQEAGIIDATTAERIIAHERRASRPVLLLAIGGLGAFTIGVGLISVIAANWGDIPRLVKLLAMLGLFGANAYGLVWARGQQYRWVTDALALGYFALTLASIALVGQTYQLGGEPYQALLLWLLVGSPALWLAEGAFAALVFLGALAVTGAFSFDPLVDLLGNDPHATLLVRASLGSAAVFGPLLVASLPILRTSGAHTKVECGVAEAACDAQLSRQMIEQGREFFIQENAGPALEQAIRRGQGAIALNVTPNGQVRVHELLIDGVPHRRWLRDNAGHQ